MAMLLSNHLTLNFYNIIFFSFYLNKITFLKKNKQQKDIISKNIYDCMIAPNNNDKWLSKKNKGTNK